jgi:hypothetical protein
LVKAGKEALGHAKEQYNIAEHKRHIEQVTQDLSPYFKKHPEEVEKIESALQIIRNAEKEMDAVNATENKGQASQINQFLVKPRRVSNTNASCYRRFD